MTSSPKISFFTKVKRFFGNVFLWILRLSIVFWLAFLLFWQFGKERVTEKLLKDYILLTDSVGIEKVDASLFHTFPNLVFELSQVSIRGKDVAPIQPDAFYSAKAEVTLSVVKFYKNALFGILKKNPRFSKWIKGEPPTVIEIERLYFDSLGAWLQVDSLSQQNYVILSPDSSRLQRRDTRPDSILIKKLYLTHSEIQYIDNHISDSLLWLSRNSPKSDSLREVFMRKRHYYFQLDTVDIGVKIDKNIVHLYVNNMDGKSRFMGYGNTYLFKNTPFRASGRLNLDKKPRDIELRKQRPTRLSIDTLTLEIANTQLGVTGGFESRKVPTYRDGRLIRKDSAFFALSFHTMLDKTGKTLAEIDAVIRAVSQETADLIKGFDVRGQLELKGDVEGADTFEKDPHVELHFESKNVSFSPKVGLIKEDERIQNLVMKGKFSNGEKNSLRTAFVEIEEVKGNLEELPFRGALRLDNFLEPDKLLITSKLEVDTLQLPFILPLLDTLQYDSAWGFLNLDINIEGLLKDLDIESIDKIKYGGRVGLHNVHFTTYQNGIPLKLDSLNGRFRINNSNFNIPAYAPLRGNWNGQKFVLQGTIHDIAQYIVRQSRGLNPTLRADVELKTFDLNLNTLSDSVRQWADLPAQKEPSKNTDFYFDFYSMTDALPLDLNLKLNIDQLQLTKPYLLNIDQLFSNIEFRNKSLKIRDLTLRKGKDSLRLNIALDALSSRANRLRTQLDFSFDNLQSFIETFELQNKLKINPNWQLQTDGSLSMLAVIRNNSHTDVSFKLNRLNILEQSQGIELRNISFRSEFTEEHLQERKKATFKLKDVHLELDGHPIEGQFYLSQKNERPDIDLTVKTPEGIPFQTLQKYVSLNETSKKMLSPVSNIGGKLYFETHLKGEMDSIKSVMYLPQTGRVEVDNLQFHLGAGQQPLFFNQINGGLHFRNDSIWVNNLTGNIGKSDVKIQGNAFELLPFILEGSALKADLDLYSNKLYINELIPEVHTKDSTATKGANLLLKTISQAELKGKLQVNEAHYRPEHYKDLRFDSLFVVADVRNAITIIDSMGVKFGSGKLHGRGLFDVSDTTRVGLGGEIDLQHIKIGELISMLNDSISDDLFDTLSVEGVALRGDFSTHITFSDTILYKQDWLFGEITEANIDTLTWRSGRIADLGYLPMERYWNSLSWGARKGAKLLFGLDASNLQAPDPQFLLVARDINLLDRQIFLDKLEFQSNKIYLRASGNFDLDTTQTDIALSLLKRNPKKQNRRDFTSYDSVSYKKTTLSPKIKYQTYSPRKQRRKQKGGKIKVFLRLFKRNKELNW